MYDNEKERNKSKNGGNVLHGDFQECEVGCLYDICMQVKYPKPTRRLFKGLERDLDCSKRG